MSQPTLVDRLLDLLKVDFSPPVRQPPALRVALAGVLSIAGSLVADALLVAAGTRIFPSTKGYPHFEFHDYARLTVIGVVIATLAWPVVTRLTSTPRPLFFRLAILVTLGLFLPDVWILLRGSSAQAVGVLMSMHVAIALITYNLLVHVAPAGEREVLQPVHDAAP